MHVVGGIFVICVVHALHPTAFGAFANVFLHITRFPASQGTAAKLGEPQQAREPRSTQLAKWTHWGVNPEPSACEADVIPLHHVPQNLFRVEIVMNTMRNSGAWGCPIERNTTRDVVPHEGPDAHKSLI